MILSKKETAYFNAAKAISKLSNHKYQIGCILVNQHKIISSGYNSNTKYHRVQAELDKGAFNCECLGKLHAESSTLIPLLNSKTDLSRATLYIYREHKDKTTALARPCSRCMQLIRSCGIHKIKYTTEYGHAAEYIDK